MILDKDSLDHMRTWLTSNLQNVCDADPDVLTKYILALLKKDKPELEMKEFCIDQLDVFLQKETIRFVNKLFDVIRDKSYLPADQRPKVAPKKEVPSEEPPTKSSSESRSIKLSSADAKKKEREREPTTSNASASTKGSSDRHVRASGADSKRDKEDTKPSVHRRITVTTTNPDAAKSEANGVTSSSSSRREVKEPRANRKSRSRSRERTGITRRLGVRPSARERVSPGRRPERGEVGGGESRAAAAEIRRVLRPARERSRTRSRSPRERRDRGRDKPAAAPNVELEEEDRKERPDRGDKRSRCRDYDEKGYCMRGDRCPYDHGPDPVVVEDPEYLPKMITLHNKDASSTSSKSTNAQPAPAQSNLPNLSVPPPGYNTLNPPPPGVDTIYTASSGGSATAVVSEGYNPEQPQLSDAPHVINVPSTTSTALNFGVPPPGYGPMPGATGAMIWQQGAPPPGYASLPPPPSHHNNQMLGKRPFGDGDHQQQQQQHGGQQGGWQPKRGRGGMMARLGGRGGYRGPATKPDLPDANRTVIVRKIPTVQNTIFLLSKHFSRFGDIKNIQIGYENDPESSLITYAEAPQAAAAFKSKAPILNNRFIRVFFYGDMERPGGLHQQQQQDGNQVEKPESVSKTVYNPAALANRNKPTMAPGQQPGQAPPMMKANTALIPRPMQQQMTQQSYVQLRKRRKILQQKKLAYLDLHKKKTEMYEKTVNQQKSMFEKLDKMKNAEQKKELMKMIKMIDKSAIALKAELTDITKKLKALTAAAAAADRAGKPTRTKQMVVKETVDLELEIMSLKQAGKDTEVQEKKLEQLKEELKTAPDESEVSVAPDGANADDKSPRALGLAASRLLRRSSSSTKSRSAQLIPASANLDKRPRNVLVVGFLSSEKDAMIKHMTQFGVLDDFEMDKDKEGVPRAVVTYRTRKDAEQAVSLAGDFAERHISVTWAAQVKQQTAPIQHKNGDDSLENVEGGGGGATAAASVSTAGESEVVVPDANRDPSQQMSATQLLASIGDDDDDSAKGSEDGEQGDDDVLLNDDELVDEEKILGDS